MKLKVYHSTIRISLSYSKHQQPNDTKKKRCPRKQIGNIQYKGPDTNQ